MKSTRKIIAGIMSLTLMFSSVPQVINACDIQINTSPKFQCAESRYEDAVEITDDYILNTYLADKLGDISINEPCFRYLNGGEHKVYAYDKFYTRNHSNRAPDMFYITFEHENKITLKRNSETAWNEFETLVDDFIDEQNIEGASTCGITDGARVSGYKGVDEELADKLGEYLDEKGVLESITFTPSYRDAMPMRITKAYPYKYAPVINRLIPELGLSRSDIYVDVSSGVCRLEFASGRVTQKQLLELSAEIYKKTGYISEGHIEEYKGDTSLVWIDDNFVDAESYTTESGLSVRNQGYSGYHKDAVRITDDRITAFYSEILKKINPEYANSPDFGELREFYAYDRVYFDNSKFNGEWLNRELLGKEMMCLIDFPSYMLVGINENDTKSLEAVLEEKFSLAEKNIRINSYNGHMDIRGFYSDMTEELAESILKEMKNMGYTVNAQFHTSRLSDGLIEGSDVIPAEYPIGKQEEIMAIVKESGVNAKAQPCQHYTDDESGYFDLIFDDVYNTTQMDIVKLRTDIYEKTGECGLIYVEEFKPEYKGCLQFGLTNATTAAEKTTYVDITLGQNTGFNIFLTQLNYDHENLELVSASLKKDLGSDIEFYVSDNKSRIMLINNKAENIELSNEDVIRLAFKVKKDAPDGKYEISLSAPEDQESGVCCVNNSEVEWVKSEFAPGYITVDSKAVPKTQTKPMPLKRMYADIKDGEKALTGDTNNDGVFNVMDVLRMKRYFAGTDSTISNADVNEDGIINIADILVLTENILSGR